MNGRWMYLVEPAPATLQRLEALGSEGWELCAAADGILYFKRPAPSVQARITADQRRRMLATGRLHDAEPCPAGAAPAAPPPATAPAATHAHPAPHAAEGSPQPGAAPRRRVLHPGLLHLLASAGHTDLVAVCDRGFPAPPEVPRIDLALTDDLPTVLDVLRCARAMVVFDRLLLPEEARAVSPDRVRELQAAFPDTPCEFLPHQEFKAVARTARGLVRTGDATPYANVMFAVG